MAQDSNTIQITVDDTSPTISYSPFRDTLSIPNLLAGWNPYFDESGFASSIGQVGNGTSLHITSLDGASLGFQWWGTGIELQGNVTLASYTVTVDGKPLSPSPTPIGNVLAQVFGLEDVLHNITLTANIPPGSDSAQGGADSPMLVFDKAVISSEPVPVSSSSNVTVTLRNQTIDDNQIAFLGRWTFGSAGPDNSLQMHLSKTFGDRAVTTFHGANLVLTGLTSPTSSSYTVTLDNLTSPVLTAQSSFTAYDSLLFFASGLDPTVEHTVEIQNLGDVDGIHDDFELGIVTDGFVTVAVDSNSPPSPSGASTPIGTTSNSANTSFAKGTIAAFVLAGILAFLLLTAILFYFLAYRPRRGKNTSSGGWYDEGGSGRGRTWGRRRRTHNYTLSEANERVGAKDPKEREAGIGISTLPVLDISATSRTQAGIGRGGHKNKNLAMNLDNEEVEQGDRVCVQSRNGFGFLKWKKGFTRGSGSAESNDVDKPGSRLTFGSRNTGNANSDSSSAKWQKARSKSKGKARQLTGRSSWSPSIKLDLPIQQYHTSDPNSPPLGTDSASPKAHFPSWGGVSSFVAAEPSPQEVRNPRSYPQLSVLPVAPAPARTAATADPDPSATVEPPSYAASVSLSLSLSYLRSSQDAGSPQPSPLNPPSLRGGSNDSSETPYTIPSGPRSVSNSPATHPYPHPIPPSTDVGASQYQPIVHTRGDSSQGFLLHEGDPSSDLDLESSTSPLQSEGRNTEDDLSSSNGELHSHPIPAQRNLSSLLSLSTTTAEAIPMRSLPSRTEISELPIENLNTYEDVNNPVITEPHNLREVIRSLSPRTSKARSHHRHRRPEPTRQRDSERKSGWHDMTEDELSSLGPDSPSDVIIPIESILGIQVPQDKHHHGAPDFGILSSSTQLQGRAIRPLPKIPQTPTSFATTAGTSVASDRSEEVDDFVQFKDGVFLDVRATSPFLVDFDSRSAFSRKPATFESLNVSPGIPATVTESSLEGQYHTVSSEPSRKSSRITQIFPSSQNLPEFVQGTSRQPFRLGLLPSQSAPSASTPSPPKVSSSDHSDGVTSFLDFTSSREGSMRSRSVRTKASHQASSRFTVDDTRLSVPSSPRLKPPRIIEPRSRWSDTTVPTISTIPPPSFQQPSISPLSVIAGITSSQTGIAQEVSSGEEGRSRNSSSVDVDIPHSPRHVMDISASNRRSQISAFTTSGEPLHVHPPIECLESPIESIPMSVSELHFRHTDSEDNPQSRRATDSSIAFSHPLPESPVHTAFVYESRPFDPSIIVNRVLGLPSLSSTPTTAGYNFNHSRSLSNAITAPASLTASQRPNLSNDHLNSSEPSGQTS